MTPIISVLLPTVRPQRLPHAMVSIPEAAGAIPYEVIVVADFGPPEDAYPNTRWILSKRKGPIDAAHLAYAASEGEYVFLFNDESTLRPGALESLYYASLANPGRLLTPHHLPEFPFQYYGLPFAAFPFVHKDVVKQLGGFLDPAYGAFYADPDFSMRAHAKRIPVDVVQSAVIVHHNRHDDAHGCNLQAYFANDRATFRTRWDHLGQFRDP